MRLINDKTEELRRLRDSEPLNIPPEVMAQIKEYERFLNKMFGNIK